MDKITQKYASNFKISYYHSLGIWLPSPCMPLCAPSTPLCTLFVLQTLFASVDPVHLSAPSTYLLIAPPPPSPSAPCDALHASLHPLCSPCSICKHSDWLGSTLQPIRVLAYGLLINIKPRLFPTTLLRKYSHSKFT